MFIAAIASTNNQFEKHMYIYVVMPAMIFCELMSIGIKNDKISLIVNPIQYQYRNVYYVHI